MLKNYLCGIETGHRRGFIHKTAASPHWLLLSFKTTFFCIIDGRRIEGKPGDCLLQRRGSTVIHGPLSADEQFVNDWIYFYDDDGSIDALELPVDMLLSPSDTNILHDMIELILQESVSNDPYRDRLISDAIYRMLILLKRTSPSQNTEEDTSLSRFRKARTVILNHYGEHWTLERMAELTGYSVSRFCALYTEFFGESPMDELLQKRLEIAKQLLSLHVYKVGDVATLCGFSSVHYFSGFFRKRTGKSPKNY